MKIALCCKLDLKGAYGFIKPLADIDRVEEIRVFRDVEGIEEAKISYHCPRPFKSSILRQVSKFFKMLKTVSRDTSILIGINEMPHGVLAFLIGKIKKIPVVICVIGNPGYEKKRKGLHKFIMYFMLKRIEAVTVTGSNAKKILAANGVDENKIHVLPNSFDQKEFFLQGREKEYDVLTLSYLGPEKKLENFLTIIDILRKEMPSIKAAIAGKGPEKENLSRKVKELSLENNIDFLGFVDSPADCYNSGKVFVLTSETEGLPRTLIEAMACGVPCVSSAVGDIDDLIKNGENGFLAEDHSNLEDFAEKVKILLSDNAKYELFCKRAHEFSVENYSQTATTGVWNNILEEICGVKNV
jgi:glycosyltransferase involved in cell wall biosynthesis